MVGGLGDLCRHLFPLSRVLAPRACIADMAFRMRCRDFTTDRLMRGIPKNKLDALPFP